MYRTADELVGGAREIRATVREYEFWDRFRLAAYAAVQPQVVRTMPVFFTRAGLETATLAVVIVLLTYFNSKDGNLANALPLLSSYAIAGIRLLPALQQSITFLMEIRFYSPSVAEVARLVRPAPEISPLEASPLRRIPLLREIQLSQVSYRYEANTPLLEEISLVIKKNSRVAIVGPTGAGKSTLLDILLGLRHPKSGTMSVDELQITHDVSANWRLSVGYVPQSVYLLDASIAQNIAFGVPPHQICLEKLQNACSIANLTGFVSSLPDGLDTSVGERGVRLSGGQCQRIGIARALYHDPEVVIFDEATSSLDTVTESSVLDSLDRLSGKKTLIVIAHRLNTIWNFDTILVMTAGRLVGSGTANELLQTCPAFIALAQHRMEPGR